MTTIYRKQNEEREGLWQLIEQANQSIKTTDIKGKQYAEVNQRVKAFRFVYPRGKIETKIISIEEVEGVRACLMRCEVFDDLGNLLSVGYAEEKENSTFINKTSFIENCETSCVGRALGQAGFGIDTSIASYEEVTNAVNNQKNERFLPYAKEIKQFKQLYTEDEIKRILDYNKLDNIEGLSREVVLKYIADRKDNASATLQNHQNEEQVPSMFEKAKAFY